MLKNSYSARTLDSQHVECLVQHQNVWLCILSKLPTNSVILHFPTYGNQITLIPTEEEANPIQTKNGIHPSIARAQLNAGILEVRLVTVQIYGHSFAISPCTCVNSEPLVKEKGEEHV